MARIEVQLKRAEKSGGKEYLTGELRLETGTYRIYKGNEEVVGRIRENGSTALSKDIEK